MVDLLSERTRAFIRVAMQATLGFGNDHAVVLCDEKP
jgi:hypothetical protein